MLSHKILKKIHSRKRGWVFCAKNFLDLGPRNTIDKTLSRLADNNSIIRLVRGIYYFPIVQKNIGIIPPDINLVAKVIADNAGVTIYPFGASSANLLGISNQVQAQNIYYTNGKSFTKKISNRTIYFQHVKIKPLPKTPPLVITILSALNYLGKNNIDDTVIKKCAKYLNDIDKKYLIKMSSHVNGWVASFIPKIISA